MVIKRIFQAMTVCTTVLLVNSYASASNFVALDFSYQQGDFDSQVTNKLSTTSVTVGRIEKRYDLSVLIPYLNLTQSDSVNTETSSGIGDIIFHAGTELLANNQSSFSLYSSVGIKLASADETRGLGSGKNDYGLYLNLSKQWQHTRAALYTGYVFNGDPPGFNVENTPLYGISVSKRFTDDGTAFFSLQKSAALIKNNEDPLSLTTGIYHKLNQQYLLKGQITLGLSEGSADYGLNTGIIVWL